MLDADQSDSSNVPNIEKIETYVYHEREKERKRLQEINDDVIDRKIATLLRYTQNQNEQISKQKIKNIRESRQKQISDAFEQQKSELENRRKSDIVVQLFASGEIEVTEYAD